MTLFECNKCLLGLVLTVFLTIANANDFPVQLNFETPSGNGGLALLSESGWPVLLKMTVNDEDMLGLAVEPNFPQLGTFGYIVFDDPDGCLVIPEPGWLVKFSDGDPADPDCPIFFDGPPAADETFFVFYPDTDLPGVADFKGNGDLRALLIDSSGALGAEFHDKIPPDDCIPGVPGGHPGCVKMGPDTGGEVVDGFGIGTDDDIPGLVLLSNIGIGKVYDQPEFELAEPMGLRNLAALTTSVSYELSTILKEQSKARGDRGKPTETFTFQTKVWAHINMPPQVIRHLLQIDGCVGNVSDGSCDGNLLWRIDGGPIVEIPGNPDRTDAPSAELFNSLTYELTAFIVHGQAPSELFDEDGDGDVDSDDAELAGYIVLSNEDSISFLQLSSQICFGGGGGVFLADLDDNGETTVEFPCPTSPGDLDRPPR